MTVEPPAATALVRSLEGHGEAAECARLMVSSEPCITLGRTFETALQTIEDSGKETYVLMEDGAIAGFVILDMRGALVGYVQTICVRADRRGGGLGSRLLAFAEERIFRDSPNVFLFVSSFNRDASRLYERLGYRVVGPVADYFVRGHDEILMRKTRGTWTEFRA